MARLFVYQMIINSEHFLFLVLLKYCISTACILVTLSEYKSKNILVFSWSYILHQFTINDETGKIFQVNRC